MISYMVDKHKSFNLIFEITVDDLSYLLLVTHYRSRKSCISCLKTNNQSSKSQGNSQFWGIKTIALYVL